MGGGKIEQTPLQINNYAVSKETAALLTCLEETRDLKNHVFDALVLNNDEILVEKRTVGKKLFDAIEILEDELLNNIGASIFENISLWSSVEKYNKEGKTII